MSEKIIKTKEFSELPNDLQLGDINIELLECKDKGPAKFKMEAYTGKEIKPAGFDAPVVVDVEAIEYVESIPIRYNHNPDSVVGHTVNVEHDGKKISAEGIFSRDNSIMREIVAAAKLGFPWQASIGVKGIVVEFREATTVNGRSFENVYVVTAGKLQEISVVEHGADDETLTQIAAKKQEETNNLKNKEVVEGNSVKNNVQVNYEIKNSNGDKINMSVKDKKEDDVTLEANDTPEVILEARKEAARKDELNLLAKRYLDEGADVDQVEKLLELALKDKNTKPNAFEKDLVLANRPKSTARIGTPKVDGKVMEASLAITCGLDKIEAQYDERSLNAAQDAFPQGLTLGELIYNTARKNGYEGSVRDVRPMLQAAFSNDLRASGFSTMSLPGILSNVANKFLKEGFYNVENAWESISSSRSVRDFKEVSSYRLTGGMEFEKLAPGGEIKHGQVDEEKYTNKVDSYGRMFGITREDIINDDLDSLSAVPRRIGRGGALKLNNVFWTEFLDNGTFFAAGNDNYEAGAGTAFGVDAVSSLDTLFRVQKDADETLLGLMPSILLVPASLRIAALQMMNSTEIRGGTGKQPVANPHAGAYQVVSSAYLDGDSKLAYYLLANPSALSTIEVAFLNGQRTPIVESADADFNTLGIQMRGYFDFGVKKQDFRAGVKAKGEA